MTLKSAILERVKGVLERAGTYRAFTEEELEFAWREAVEFRGDIPPSAGEHRHQHRLEYRLARQPRQVLDLTYTARGMAWVGGTLREDCSLRPASIKEALARPGRRWASRIPRGTVIQCETPGTYGDWVSEFLVSLTGAMPLDSPLLVPQTLMSKSYVRRDLASLGLEVIEVDRPALVREATVIPKARPAHFWRASEVQAYRKAFRIEPPTPRPGSILYISREGEQSESRQRSYPSAEVAEALGSMGVRVVLARETSQEEFRALADDAETVVADHGAAMCNLLFWSPKRVIELFSEQFWTSCFLFLARAIGTTDFTLVNGDRFSRPDFERVIRDEPATPQPVA